MSAGLPAAASASYPWFNQNRSQPGAGRRPLRDREGSDDVASVWGKLNFAGAQQRFRLRLVDTGEPGREDRFELTVASGYEAGQGAPISGGNVQVHSA